MLMAFALRSSCFLTLLSCSLRALRNARNSCTHCQRDHSNTILDVGYPEASLAFGTMEARVSRFLDSAACLASYDHHAALCHVRWGFRRGPVPYESVNGAALTATGRTEKLKHAESVAHATKNDTLGIVSDEDCTTDEIDGLLGGPLKDYARLVD